MLLVEIAVWGLALLGHGALWVAFVNHLNATGMPHQVVSMLSKAAFGCLVGWPAWLAYWGASNGFRVVGRGDWANVPSWLIFYCSFCLLIAVGPLPWHLVRQFPHRCARLPGRRSRVVVDVAGRLGRRPVAKLLGRALSRFPGNQIWQLEVNEKQIELPRLPERLDGLSIAHLSDLHFTGNVTCAFFQQVVDLTNQMQPDVIAITGDVFDDLRLTAWLPTTLGSLQSQYGSYFVLGNHDYKVGAAEARAALLAAGLSDSTAGVPGIDVGGYRVELLGTERPWGPLPQAGAAEPGEDNPPLRILLAHTPDQLPWAQRHGFDLMLAGHSHGGQVRLPWIGPVVCPLRGGIKYAAGTFHEPPTVMHVSRGISSQLPIRLNCRPELVKLVLRCSHPVSPSAAEELGSELEILQEAAGIRQELEPTADT